MAKKRGRPSKSSTSKCPHSVSEWLKKHGEDAVYVLVCQGCAKVMDTREDEMPSYRVEYTGG